MTTALRSEGAALTLGTEVTDGLIRGPIIQIDETRDPVLYLLEYEVWAGEPKRRTWCRGELLVPCAGMTIDKACAHRRAA